MEFLRFGGRIPGSGIGCCAIDVIQGFSSDPDEKASTQLVHGDSGTSLGSFLGKTNKEIFLARLRVGTFSDRERPCRAFLCSITETQLKTLNGLKWLSLLRENGFEFIRSVHNSVYGDSVPGGHVNHIFGLFRNIGGGAVPDPFTPPAAWTTLPEPKSQEEVWEAGKDNLQFYTQNALAEEGINYYLSGKAGAAPRFVLSMQQIGPKSQPKPKDPFVEVIAAEATFMKIVAQDASTGVEVTAD